MKKTFLLFLSALMAFGAYAQDSTALYQNFNFCDSNTAGEHFPPGWYAYAVLSGGQNWNCESEYGVNNSPCLEFNDYVKGFGDNGNEAWLFTPKLNLSSYAGSIYLNFAAEYYFGGDSLHVFVSSNYSGTGSPYASGVTWAELSHTGCMLCDSSYNSDIFDEFQVDLSWYKTSPVYVGFKYTSTDSNGSRWDIDSVTTGTVSFGPILGVAKVTKEELPLKVLGMSTPDQIKLEFNVEEGAYNLAVYDIVGRKVYDNNISVPSGEQSYIVTGIDLAKGMYIIKLGNQNSYGVTKAIVQ